jgi:hypothetical protein
MLNKKWLNALGISIPVLTIIILSGIFVKADSNLFNTGLTPSILIIAGQLFLVFCIWKKHI